MLSSTGPSSLYPLRLLVLLLFACPATLPVLSAQSTSADAACQRIVTQIDEGTRRLSQKDYLGAIEAFRLAREACPESEIAALQLARAYLAARQFPQGELTAKAIVATYPRSEQAQFLLAYSYFMQERFPEAGETLKRLLAQNDTNPDAHKLMGLTLFFYKQYVMAERELRIALKLRPQDEEAAYHLGRIYYTQNRFGRAVAALERAIAMNPRSYKAYDNLGLCYEAMGKTEVARIAFKKAQELAREDDPSYDWPSANMAEMLIKADRTDEALPYAQEAVRINPRSAKNHYLLGKALSRRIDPQASVEHLQKAAELDPHYPEPHYVLARLYRKLGRTAEARHEFDLFRKISEEAPQKKPR